MSTIKYSYMMRKRSELLPSLTPVKFDEYWSYVVEAERRFHPFHAGVNRPAAEPMPRSSYTVSHSMDSLAPRVKQVKAIPAAGVASYHQRYDDWRSENNKYVANYKARLVASKKLSS